MNKNGEANAMVTLILLAMVIFIGFALIIPAVSVSNMTSEKQSVINESTDIGAAGCIVEAEQFVNGTADIDCNVSVTHAAASTDWRASDSQCDLGGVTITNGTMHTFVEGTDYNLFGQTIQFLNTTDTATGYANVTNISYSFCNPGYFQDTASRSLVKLIATLMIMVLLITAAAVAYKQFGK